MAASPSGLTLKILGPLRVWRDGVELDPGPRQQAYLLALLIGRQVTALGAVDFPRS